jgi:hypothetical protein
MRRFLCNICSERLYIFNHFAIKLLLVTELFAGYYNYLAETKTCLTWIVLFLPRNGFSCTAGLFQVTGQSISILLLHQAFLGAHWNQTCFSLLFRPPALGMVRTILPEDKKLALQECAELLPQAECLYRLQLHNAFKTVELFDF